MKKLLLLALIFCTTMLLAQDNQPLIDLRPAIQKVFESVKTGNPDLLMSMRLKKSEVVEFQKLLNQNKGKGMDEEINKLLKEIDGLVANFEEFDASQLKDLTNSYTRLLVYDNENGFDWKNARFLFETYSLRKRGPFHVEASVQINTLVKMSDGVDRRVGMRFELILIGSRWAIIEGVNPEFDYGNDQSNDEAVEVIEEEDDGDY